MSQSSESSNFQALFNAALQDYKDKTGSSLIDHPIAKQLESCESVSSINSILQEQAQSFREFRENDGKLKKALDSSVDVLCAPSISSALNVAIGFVPFPPANAIFAGFGILLTTVKEMHASYDALVDHFASFESFLSRLSIYTGVPPTPALTNILVKIIVELISTLALATKQVKQGRFKKFMGKLRGEKDIEATIQRLDRLTLDEGRATAAQTLEVVYGLVQQKKVIMDNADGNEVATGISRALESMQEIISELKKEQRNKLQQDVRNWLSPPDPWKNHNLARESRHGGTGRWWVEGDTHAEWKSSGASSLLWIHGKPGAGKSIICSAIIEDIRTLQRSGMASLAFFYCDFRDDQKKDRRELLSSLLVQLGEQSDAYSAILSKFYEAHRRGSQQSHASDSELADCLKDMLKLPGQAPTYIVVDALDECPVTTGLVFTRKKVLELLEELVNLHIPNVRICVTSRPEADIMDVLDNLASCSVSLHGESGQVQDIAEYIRSFVHTSREMRRWKATDKQLVIDELTNNADGMFRWVVCQLVYLSRCIPGRIRHALRELPTTLDATYARTLEEIDDQNWDYAHRLFQCVAAASRPLRAEELAEFLAFDFDAGSTPEFLADWRTEDPENEVLSICSTLLVVVKQPSDSPVIQFAHFSVKEYLTSARLAEIKHTISRFHVSMTPAHTIVAQACLGVLLHLDENITEDRLKDFPLAEYAARHWVDHAWIDNVSSKVQDGMKCLFDPSKSHLSVWVWIHDPEITRDQPERPGRPAKARGSSLHYAALCNMHDIASFLIIDHSQDVNARGSHKVETPLHVSSRLGYVEIAWLLLKHGADIEARDENNYSPLDRAAENGHVEVAQVLLEHGALADGNPQDPYDLTPLLRASGAGHLVVAQVLLSHGAEASAQCAFNESPLHRALGEEVARLLLEHGADANALSMYNQTPLHYASLRGDVGAAQALLEHGVDVTARSINNQTPLHLARGEKVARLLLEYGADPNSLDINNGTPLHHASEYGTEGAARVLLEHGVDVTALCKKNQTPLHLASGEKVARLLLEHGADANALDFDNLTPLHHASEHGDEGAARVLLEYGVDVTVRCKNNETPLHKAKYEGVARLLLEHGADMNALDINNRTPLHRLSEDSWRFDGVRVLLENGAEVNARDTNNATPLHLASGPKREVYVEEFLDIVRLLLQYGSDIHAQDDEGQTPFMRAKENGKHLIMQLLLDHGAEDLVNREGSDDGDTHAMEGQSRETLQRSKRATEVTGGDLARLTETRRHTRDLS